MWISQACHMRCCTALTVRLSDCGCQRSQSDKQDSAEASQRPAWDLSLPHMSVRHIPVVTSGTTPLGHTVRWCLRPRQRWWPPCRSSIEAGLLGYLSRNLASLWLHFLNVPILDINSRLQRLHCLRQVELADNALRADRVVIGRAILSDRAEEHEANMRVDLRQLRGQNLSCVELCAGCTKEAAVACRESNKTTTATGQTAWAADTHLARMHQMVDAIPITGSEPGCT